MIDAAASSDNGASPAVPADRPAAKTSPLRKPVVRIGLLLGGAGLLALGVVAGLGWWTHGRFVESTNNAYLRADQVTIAPKVQGYVEQVFVVDNQQVAAGQPLVKIDTSAYDTQVAQQEAAAEGRQADIVAAERQVAQQQAAITQAQAQLAGSRAVAVYAQRDVDRYAPLVAQGVETAERLDQARRQRDQALAQVKSDAAGVETQARRIPTLQAQIGQARAQLTAAEAQVRNARLNVGDTLLRAGAAGRVGDKTVRVGQFVQPGARLMSVVPVQDVYLVANFKETQIGRMHVGQRATVRVDALKGQEIDAALDSFAPGTGAQFALLPPENATGNFTKIVQRVPVRFRLRAPESLREKLLPGLSAEVKVDTTQAARR